MGTGEIMFIEGDGGARFPHGNAIFVDDEVPTVIDPATKPELLKRLKDDKGVRLVLNSHYHIDHTRYNSIFEDATFAAHEFDAPAIQSLDENARFVGIERQPWVEGWKKVMRDVWGYRETRVGKPLRDMDEICLGENTIRVIHAPGHTPGHICIEFVEKRAVYLADIDLTRFGPWYGNLRSSIDSFLESIERLKSLSAETWYTAHGEGILEGDIRERLDSYARVIHEREERICDFLSEPRAREEIIDRALVYGKKWEPPQMFEFFEWMMVSKHLERLEKKGLVREIDGRWALV